MVEAVGSLPLGQSTGRDITTTIAGEWLNSLIFHNDIKCITANGQTIIYVDAICAQFFL